MEPISIFQKKVLLSIGILPLIGISVFSIYDYQKKSNSIQNPESITIVSDHLANRITQPTARFDRDTGISTIETIGDSKAPMEKVSKYLANFLDKQNEISSKFEGRARHVALLQLMAQASEQLSLGDLEKLCNKTENVVIATMGMRWLGSRYALENTTDGFKWLSINTNDTSSAAAFSGFASSLPAGELDYAIKFALNLENRAMATAFVAGLIGKGELSTTDLVIDAINKKPNILTGVIEVGMFPAALASNGHEDSILPLCNKVQRNDLRLSAYRNALLTIVSDSPKRASELFLKIPNQEDQSSVIDALMTTWLRTDPMTSSEWASKLPTGNVRDAAASAIVSSVLTLNQEDAMRWAASIESKELRSKEIEKVVNFTKLNNPSQLGNVVKISE